jgi:hypothetical protein
MNRKKRTFMTRMKSEDLAHLMLERDSLSQHRHFETNWKETMKPATFAIQKKEQHMEVDKEIDFS